VAISADGSRVAFVSARVNDFGNYDLFFINSDGTGLTQLSAPTEPTDFYNLLWMPDGRNLAAIKDDGDGSSIWVTTPTSGPTRGGRDRLGLRPLHGAERARRLLLRRERADDAWNEALSAFGNHQPRIAPLFDDWVVVGETATSGVFVNSALPGKVVFTWANVLAFRNSEDPVQAEKATFQVTLHQDGRLEMGYRGVDTRGGLAGVTPGGGDFQDSPTAFMDDISTLPLFPLSTYEFSYYELFGGATSQRPFDLDGHVVSLTPQESGGYQVRLQRPLVTTVRGVVEDSNGSPLRGVRVTALDRQAVTNSDGSFDIFEVNAERGAVAAAVTHPAPGGQLFEAQSAPATPVAGGATDVGALALRPAGEAFDADLGQPVALAAGPAGTQLPLPFPFRFYGASPFAATYQSVYVNSNGYLMLAQGCVREDCADGYGTADTAVNEHAFVYSRVPVVAPFYSALDAATGQVYVKSEADRWVLTFKNVRRDSASAGDNTFQVVLRADGRIRFAYDGVSNTFAHVGLAPGGFAGLSEGTSSLNWSQLLVRATGKAMPMVETFTGDFGGQPVARPFDLDHSAIDFVPRAGGGYDVLRRRLPGHESRRRVLFDSGRDGWYEVWAMNADGSDQVSLTNRPGDNYFAALSPDGTKVAFITDRHATDELWESKIYVMNADGSDPRMLSDAAGDDYRPTWSPDGTKLLFRAFDFSQFQRPELFSVNVDGSNLTRLTNMATMDKGYPRFSPDGAQIAFWVYQDDLNGQVYVMNSDGLNVRNISASRWHDFFGSWSIVP